VAVSGATTREQQNAAGRVIVLFTAPKEESIKEEFWCCRSPDG